MRTKIDHPIYYFNYKVFYSFEYINSTLLKLFLIEKDVLLGRSPT